MASYVVECLKVKIIFLCPMLGNLWMDTLKYMHT